MARFAWQRLTGTAGFVQWKLLTVSGFVRRKPRGWQDSRDNSHRVRQESPSGSRPPPECGKIRSVGVTPPGGVARFVQWESLSMSRFAQQESPRGGEGWQDLLAMHDLRGLDGKRAS